MFKEVKQEGSIPVQSRVNVCDLANVGNYLEQSGYKVSTMSQLVAWSVGLMCEVLCNDGKASKGTTVAEAHHWLMERGLYQKSMLDRSYKKIGAAIRFEEMRQEGVDPKESSPEVKRVFSMLHRKGSVTAFEGNTMSAKAAKAVAKYNELFDENGNPRPAVEPVVIRDKMTDTELDAKARQLELDHAEKIRLENIWLAEQAGK